MFVLIAWQSDACSELIASFFYMYSTIHMSKEKKKLNIVIPPSPYSTVLLYNSFTCVNEFRLPGV